MKPRLYILIAFLWFLAIVPVYPQISNTRVTSNTADQSETAIAANPMNSDTLVGTWNDFRSGVFSQAGYAVSLNGGSTWSEGIVRAPNNLSSYIYGFDPSVAIDRGRRVFYCYIGTSGISLGGAFVARSTNFGSSWDTVKQVSSTLTSQDKPFMAVDNTGGSYDGRIYVSWTDFSSGSAIKFTYSSDHGLNYSSPATMSSLSPDPGTYAQLMPSTSNNPGSPTTVFVQGSMPAIGPNMELYLIWMDVNYGYNAGTYKIRKSTDGGATFGAATTVAQFTWIRSGLGGLDIMNLPSLAVSPTTGYVYAAFMDQASQTNTDRRVKWTRSTDGGSTWSSPAIIADFGGGWQFFPWVAVSSTGRIAVHLLHSADLDSIDSYITESFDNGSSFTAPVRITSQRSDPGNSSWTHHYQGVAAAGAAYSFPLWTDYRNGNSDPYFSKANPAPSVPKNVASSGSVGQHPTISWSANPEQDLSGYKLYRKITPDESQFSLVATLSTSQTSWTDIHVTIRNGGTGGQYAYYYVKAYDAANNLSNASATVYKPVNYNPPRANDGEDPILALRAQPVEFALEQNYPNPFNPSTTIHFALPENSFVTLKVYDVLGKEVATLVNEERPAGYNDVQFDASQLSSGIHFYQIQAGTYRAVKKMILMK